MSTVCAAASVALILWTLMEAFEVMVLPRRVTRQFRFTRLFYRGNWHVWLCVARGFRSPKRRETFLSVFGPLSLLTLFSSWVVTLIAGFALLHWSLGTPLQTPTGETDLSAYLYFSGITFFTIGYGDVVPLHTLGRGLAVVEGGVGFGFLAVTIGYMPVLYQAFSRREATISLLDARASSPPSAGQFLLRLAPRHDTGAGDVLLAEWERWSAELLESHLSFPVLSYYRSQHDNQSWLAALMTILDVSALVMVGVDGIPHAQARLTFAMARHTVVDLTQIFNTPPIPDDRNNDRLPAEKLIAFRKALREQGVVLRDDAEATEKLKRLRALYEPHARALASFLVLTLPPFRAEKERKDNWQTSAWKKMEGSEAMTITEEHF
jgi:hypothetical protein